MRRSRKRVSVALLIGAVSVLGLMTMAQLASATHPRPKGATPLRVSIVPSFKPCTSPNRTHGAPLAFPSCAPPVQTSTYLTVGSPDANGAAANSVASIRLDVQAGVPGPPEDSDVLIKSSGSDIRCTPAGGASVCATANAADGPDYSGELQGPATIRISDHYIGPNLNEAATVQDIPFPVNATCVATTSTSIGGLCTANTSANAAVPGSVKDTQRAVVEIQQLQINDGGADGTVATPDNTLFGVQGIFIP
jgi:hypothetical protein